ncbi:30S ribosomal protein S8 [Candidatus Woesebacteria bacterium]|nr:30S ribosomal protein S8 [Candidatus Woesebacteria bacterium]
MISTIDLAIRIKNGYLAKKPEILVRGSKLSAAVLEKLISEGYIESYTVAEDGPKKVFTVKLRYAKNNTFFTGVKIISKPGQREYVKSQDIPVILNGLGSTILSTTSGIMTGKEARKAGLGGELLFSIW